MDLLENITQTISFTMGAAWASGINLYATLMVIGLMGSEGYIILPETLSILMHPGIITVSAIMFIIEFCADKIPGVDTLWDGIHSFIRIPAGAFLAASILGQIDPAYTLIAAIVGGGLATSTHMTKASARLLINTSPEPISNWTASITEDILAISGLWIALHYPILFLVLLGCFIGLVIWMLPKILRGIKKVFSKIFSFFKKSRND